MRRGILLRKEGILVFIEEISAYGGIFFGEDYETVTLAELADRDDELAGFVAALLLLLLFRLQLGLGMQIPHRVRLLDLATQNKLDAHLMFPSSLEPSRPLGVGLEFLLEIGAEVGLRKIGAIDLVEVGVGVSIEDLGV